MKLSTLFFSVLTFSICYSQPKKSNLGTFPCKVHCPIKDDPIHFNPYYNAHLCENFNPAQVDFSKEYFDLESKKYSNDSNLLRQTLKFDYSSVWLTHKLQQNGVLGPNYQRIQFHIDRVTKSKSRQDTYIIYGKSKVNDNICDFKGELKLLKQFASSVCDEPAPKKCGDLFGSYTFYDDSTKTNSGVFRGIMECFVNSDSTGTKMVLDDNQSLAVGYYNRTFIGTWTDYKTKKSKKCIWGDYRLPFVFDFMCGNSEMMPCEKYAMNGWQTFNDEFIETGKNQWELKDKWWLPKKPGILPLKKKPLKTLLSRSYSHPFSESAKQDTFKLILTGKSIADGQINFEIWDYTGKKIYDENFLASDLLYDEADVLTTRQKLDTITKRFKNFFSAGNFVHPAIKRDEIYYSDECPDKKIWNEIKSDPASIGFIYSYGYEGTYGIAYSRKNKKVVHYFSSD